MVPNKIPHIKPDHVLFGDKVNDNFFPPKYFPNKKEKISVLQTIKRNHKNNNVLDKILENL